MQLPSSWPRPFHHIPAHVLNGIGVALGIGLIQAAVGTLGGAGAAFAATGGAVFASLADLPNAPHRTLRRVATCGAVGCAVGVLVSVLRSHDVVLGFLTAAIAFVTSMSLAWGPRAGPMAVVGVLAIVFTTAAPPTHGVTVLALHAFWTTLGAALYLVWSIGTAMALRHRYRTLALAAALAATVQLLRSRARLLEQDPTRPDEASPLQAWIACEAALSERSQAARDLLFAAADAPQGRRQTGMLLSALDLRDTLHASDVDLNLIGHDGADGQVRTRLAAHLCDLAATLDALQQALRLGRAAPRASGVGGHVDGPDGAALNGVSNGVSNAAPNGPPGNAAGHAPNDILRDVDLGTIDPQRSRLLQALRHRSRHMTDDVERIRNALGAADATVPLQREQLQLFVSLEGWPLAALRPHFRASSPVLRHAVRFGLALGSAYFIAEALPWGSHPAWLMLSVAVVLRGNLQQTLSRRNARIAGTVFGCLLVLLLARLGAAWLSLTVFLIAVGVAHSYTVARYLFTAVAATVMALLLSHLANPVGQLAVGERLADTVLGALLAWGFSYVLPAWERQNVARVAGRVTDALAALARQTLRRADDGSDELAMRLARREVYDALDGIAGAAQRTRVEPERVRVPLYALATLLGRSQALMAHLAAVKLLLTRRAGELDHAEVDAALGVAAADLERRLRGARGDDLFVALATEPAVLPTQPGDIALMPWLQRRLQLASQMAGSVAEAAAALRAVATA